MRLAMSFAVPAAPIVVRKPCRFSSPSLLLSQRLSFS
jgi:hypothetical protein